jgi:hypothetical protein
MAVGADRWQQLGFGPRLGGTRARANAAGGVDGAVPDETPPTTSKVMLLSGHNNAMNPPASASRRPRVMAGVGPSRNPRWRVLEVES